MKMKVAVLVPVVLLGLFVPAVASASGGWHVVPNPNPKHKYNSMNGVVRFSATDAWAVGGTEQIGYHQSFGRTDPIMEHWDGSTWQMVATPHTRRWAALYAIGGTSPSDIWAVGSRGAPHPPHSVDEYQGRATPIARIPDRVPGGFFNPTARSLIEHYNGSAWTIVPSPNPAAGGFFSLNAVSAFSTRDAWAVGTLYSGDESRDTPIALHWDGVAWSAVPTPSTGSPYTDFNDVEQTSAADAWVVGTYWVPEAHRPLAEHWDGTRWSIVKPPRKGPQDDLVSVSATSPTDVWAVGGSDSDPSGMIPLAYHWDGTAWTLTSMPNPVHGIILAAVAAFSTIDVWAYGDYGLRRARPAYEHWDGTAWTMVTAPQPSKASNIYDIAAGPGGAFAVGQYYPSIWHDKNLTLIEACC
jgi:hypothetical protein